MQQAEEREARATQAYLVATTLGILCIVPRPFLDSAFGAQVSFLLVMPAVVVAGWWGGAGPAVVTAVLSVAGTVGFYVARGGSLLDAGAAGTLIFILMSMTWLCWFGAQLHRLRLRSLEQPQPQLPVPADIEVEAEATAAPTVFELNQQLHAEQARFEAVRRTHEAVIVKLGHELRTPLNTILGWARLLDMDPASTPAVQHAAEVIARNARHQAELIDRLFDLHGVFNGSVSLEVHPVDAADVAGRAMQAVMQRAAGKHITISNSVPHGARVLADAHRLRQMLEHLLDNAVKFTPEGGHVELGGERRAQAFVISVQDTGEGIAAEFLPQAFERFRQADDSSTRRHGGLGVGLALVKALAELQQGQVHAFSEGPGRGARFEVELPLPEPAEVPVTPSADDTGGWPQALAGLRALVVDDEADGRELVCEILTRHGAEVDVAPDAETALQRQARAHYDLLVSDVAMPGMNGYDLLRQWRRHEEGSGLRRAIALTAFAGAEARQLAQDAGYDCLLNKPVEPGELVHAAAAQRTTDARPQVRGALCAGRGRAALQ